MTLYYPKPTWITFACLVLFAVMKPTWKAVLVGLLAMWACEWRKAALRRKAKP